MTISANAVSSDSSATQQATAAAAKNTLGKDDFLKLLTAQLSNQDPLQPVDNQAFIAQLAQFSSLEQMQNISTQLDTLTQAMTTSSTWSATALVGKTVTYNTGTVEVADGATPTVKMSLASDATVTAIIQDSGGRTVRTLSLGSKPAGTSDLGWDGRDTGGNRVPAGSYAVTLVAKDAAGAAVDATAQATGVVQGVSLSGGATQLVVGASQVDLSDVVQITNS
jgi:flagellar basal-body rod modification protein FlgD